MPDRASDAAYGPTHSRLRTLVFRGVFYSLSVPVVLTAAVASLWGQRALIAYADRWSKLHRVLLRALLGIRSRVEGEVPTGQVLYAAKHQAMYETLELQLILGSPAMVLKRELTKIPVWGWASRLYGSIPVDREASAAALRQLMKDAAAAKATGRSVVVYPEGTRVRPGDMPPLRSGFAGLYKALSLPVVPIALDSGRVLSRDGRTRSGIVTIRLGEPVPPGLPRREAEQRVWEAMNALELEAGAGSTPDA